MANIAKSGFILIWFLYFHLIVYVYTCQYFPFCFFYYIKKEGVILLYICVLYSNLDSVKEL